MKKEERFPDLGGWNHRVIRTELPPDSPGKHWYAIHEVYYTTDGKPSMYTEGAEAVEAETVDSLRWVLDKMREALEKPVLTEADFPKDEVTDNA